MRQPACAAVTALFLALPAVGKLPALGEEAKAKADEAAAKTAWADKVGLYKLCQRMDRVAATYRQGAASAAAPVETPPCADPGPFVAPVTAQKDKPLEASEAHSPTGMAVSPPSNKATAAELGTGGKPKP